MFKYDEILCPKCKGPMISRTGKFGIFWGCKSFPNCDGTRDSEGRSREDRNKERAIREEESENILGQSESNRYLEHKISFRKN